MIALLGGRYNGKYVDRERPPVGSTIGIIITGDIEIYRMRADGVAEVVDPSTRMDQAEKADRLQDSA